MPGRKKSGAKPSPLPAGSTVTAERWGPESGCHEYQVTAADGSCKWLSARVVTDSGARGAEAIAAFRAQQGITPDGSILGREITPARICAAAICKALTHDEHPVLLGDDVQHSRVLTGEDIASVIHPWDLREKLTEAGVRLAMLDMFSSDPPPPAADQKRRRVTKAAAPAAAAAPDPAAIAAADEARAAEIATIDELLGVGAISPQEHADAKAAIMFGKPPGQGLRSAPAAAAAAGPPKPPIDPVRALVNLCPPEEPGAGCVRKRTRQRAGQRYREGADAWALGTGFGGARSSNPGAEEATAKAQALKAQQAQSRADGELAAKLSAVVQMLRDCGGRQPLWPRYTAFICSDLPSEITRLLRNDSLMDISERTEVYHYLTELLKQLTDSAALAPLLLVPVGRGDRSPRELLDELAKQAGWFISQVRKQDTDDAAAVSAAMSIRDAQSAISGHVDLLLPLQAVPPRSEPAGAADAAAEESEDDGVGQTLAELRREANRRGIDTKKLRTKVALNAAIAEHRQKEQAAAELQRGAEERYLSEMSELKFAIVDLSHKNASGQTLYAHKYVSDIAMAPDAGRQRQTRIMKEIAGLAGGLPTHWASSIYVRVDEQRNDVWKALIIGPEGTPYANGCFCFDIFLGYHYPNEAPRVWLTTTFGNRIRFNPNLYNDGKVCLSLLGTWHGPAWDPKASTMMQVLLSIQGMILVKDPFYNEPSWEQRASSEAGRAKCQLYSRYVQLFTARAAILAQLKEPPAAWKDVITTHFRLKGEYIKQQLREWFDPSLPPLPPVPDSGLGFPAVMGGRSYWGACDSNQADGQPSKVLSQCDAALDAVMTGAPQPQSVPAAPPAAAPFASGPFMGILAMIPGLAQPGGGAAAADAGAAGAAAAAEQP